MLNFPDAAASTSVSCSTDQIDALGSLLKYGLPGLALGIFLAALVLGVAWKVSSDPTRILKVMLGFGLSFLVVGGLFATYLGTHNPQVHVEVMVDPNPGDLKLPLPEIRSKLSSKPDHDMVLVQDADYVKVDITGILRAYDTARKQHDSLLNQLASVEKSTSSAIAAARIGQADLPALPANASSAGAANPVAAAADKACTKDGGASCGWAPFARGDIAGAQQKFQQVTLDASAVQPQKAAAYKGLGYTYVAQGKPEQAAEQFKRSSELGDREAALQLKAINAATAAQAAH